MSNIISKNLSFDNSNIRSEYKDGIIYHSVIDCIEYLTGSENPRKYWSKLKERCLDDGIQLETFCLQLKVTSSDKKKYLSDFSTRENMIFIMQYIDHKIN